THQSVCLFGFSADKDDGHVARQNAHPPAGFITALIGHHDVQTDEIWPMRLEPLYRFAAIDGGNDAVAFALEQFGQALSRESIVLCYQHLHPIRSSLTTCDPYSSRSGPSAAGATDERSVARNQQPRVDSISTKSPPCRRAKSRAIVKPIPVPAA